MSYVRTCLVLISTWIATSGCNYYDCDGSDRDHDRWGRDPDWCEEGGRCEADAGPSIDAAARERDAGVNDAGAIPRCASDDDCASGEVCVEGSCRSEEDTCHFDVECGPSRRCVDAACRPRCSAGSECPSGTRCESELCLPAVECSGDAECAGGERCVETRCLPECGAGHECAHTEDVCGADGLCRPDASPRPFCSSDADCATSRLCLRGVCRTPCPSGEDVECLGWDSQFVRCGLSESGLHLCYTHHEWSPECRTAGDCEDGRTCIDAICH